MAGPRVTIPTDDASVLDHAHQEAERVLAGLETDRAGLADSRGAVPAPVAADGDALLARAAEAVRALLNGLRSTGDETHAGERDSE